MQPNETKTTSADREVWLARATDALRPVFAGKGYDVPENIRVSVGFPHGKHGRGTAIGQCWTDAASDGAQFEIFISPILTGKGAGTQQVAATLAHEIAHATVGLSHGHDRAFGKCVRSIGLTGANTATVAGSAFGLIWEGGLGIAGFDETGLVESVGEFPHESLRTLRSIPKQKTRLIKVECDDCHDEGLPFIVRMSAGTIASHGTPICPVHERHMQHGQG